MHIDFYSNVIHHNVGVLVIGINALGYPTIKPALLKIGEPEDPPSVTPQPLAVLEAKRTRKEAIPLLH